MNCVWFDLLCRIPFAGLRLPLSRRHVERCPRCLRASESGEALPPILVRPDRLPPGPDLRPLVRARIDAPAAAWRPARRAWRWGYAAAALALFLLAGIVVLLSRRTPLPPASSTPSATPLVHLVSARIADQPARVFRVQSRNPDRAIFWIAKSAPRS